MNRNDLRHIILGDDLYGDPTTDEEKAQKWTGKTLKARKSSDAPEMNILPMRLHEADETTELCARFKINLTRKQNKMKDSNGSPNGGEGTSAEMPKYRSHKQVWALKIKDLVFDSELAEEENRETDGGAIITPEEEGYAPFKVDHAYCKKHEPKVGGYYVVYEDGYKSFSPAEAFKGGYTRI